MVLSESLSDHFLEHNKKTEPTATPKKLAKPAAEEASANLQIKTPSHCLQQTNSPADYGESIARSRCIPGWTGTFKDALYKKVASKPKRVQYVGIQ